MSIKNTLKEIIIKSIDESIFKIEPNDIIIKFNKEDNSYITNIAIIIAKNINKSPNDIAILIQQKINNHNIIEKTTTNEGLINIFLESTYITTIINDIISKKNKYGKINLGNKQKISLSFIIPNLDKDLSLEDGRNAIFCDNLEKIYTNCNYTVTKECYIKKISSENDINSLKQQIDNCRIYIDNYLTEEDLYNNSIIENFLTKIRYTNYCYINNNELWIKTTEFGDKKDKLIVTEDGNYTEIVPLIAYNNNRYNTNYEIILDLYNKNDIIDLSTIKNSLTILNKDISLLKEIIQGDITLNNNINNITELINKVGKNNFRYIFSLYNINKNMNLDINYFEKTNKENPFNYIEEANIKITSILNKYKKKIHKVDNFTTLKNDIAYTIMYKLLTFKDVIINSCLKNNPSIIAYYTYELADLFHKYYEIESLQDKTDEYINERLNILLATKIILNKSLNLIGIIPME